MPCQTVSNKLEVFNLPTEFENIRKLEKFLIANCILFKKLGKDYRNYLQYTSR